MTKLDFMAGPPPGFNTQKGTYPPIEGCILVPGGSAMRSNEERLHYLAICFAILAGFVDAVGYLQTGRLFVSFMSGNSTQLGVDTVSPSGEAGTAAMLIALFVAGVIGGALVAAAAGARRKAAVIAEVSLVLFLAALFQSARLDFAAVLTMAFAMGSGNTVFQGDESEFHVGVTYMTGNLVKFGMGLVSLLVGARKSWLPYLVLWIGLIVGAILGALTYGGIKMGALWIAASAAAVLAFVARGVKSPPR
jgi:uncharacterized membrane protein YoaK (UPF0700 family)